MNQINHVNFLRLTNPETSLNGSVSINSDNTNIKSFKNVVQDMMSELNEVTNKPQELTQQAMLGNADIHDVMSAIAESELTVQTATTITGKILQTYEKIMQIQI